MALHIPLSQLLEIVGERPRDSAPGRVAGCGEVSVLVVAGGRKCVGERGC